MFSNPGRHPIHIGLDPDLPDEATLGIVLAAKVMESGRHVVVLDLVPPFVKVFDQDGRLRAAFLQKGGGPLELTGPGTLATSGDSIVLVIDQDGRFSLFDLDDRLLRQSRRNDIIALAAAEYCIGEWLIYGPRFHRGAATIADWLHRARFDGDSIVLRSAFTDSIASDAIGVGRPYGMVRTSNGVLVRHMIGATPSILRMQCGEEEPYVVTLPPDATKDRIRVSGGAGPRMVRMGSRIEMGIASLSDGFVQADVIVAPTAERSATVLDSWSRRYRIAGVHVKSPDRRSSRVPCGIRSEFHRGSGVR